MMNFLRRLAFNRGRGIFEYFDGRVLRKGDPIQLWVSLERNPNYVEGHWKLLESDVATPVKKAELALELAQVTRDVFGIPELDAGGLATQECVAVLRKFRLYAALQKKSSEPKQIVQPPTESSSSQDSGENGTDISDGSVSCSTWADFEQQQQNPSASE